MVSLAIFIPYFDQRRIKPVPRDVYEKIEPKLIRIINATHRGGHNEKGARVITIPKTTDPEYLVYSINSVQNPEYRDFIITVLDENYPQQRTIGRREISGPFEVKGSGFYFFLILPKLPQSFYVSKIFDTPFLLISVMIILSLPFIFLITYSLYRPIQRLKIASKRVAEGDWELDPKLEKGTIEFGTLGKSFNEMTLALKNAEAVKNRLFANLSHELRTPLTRIRLTNSMIRRKSQDHLENEVERIENNLILIENRIQAMLALSRQMVLNRDQFSHVNLKEILLTLFEEAQFEAEENHKTLIYSEIPDVDIVLNVENFQSGLENILRNAIHYSRQKVEATLSIEDQLLSIVISDDGPGVNPNDIGQLFEAFFRGEKHSDIPDSNGAGLGLAIAHQMVKSHHGKIFAENNVNGGLTITLILPLSQEQ